MTAIAALAASMLLTFTLSRRPPAPLRSARHLRENYRRAPVPGTLGVVLLLPVAIGAAAAAAAGSVRVAVAALGAALVLAVSGLYDDLRGESGPRGFAGHIRFALRGRITTGLVKAGVGGAVGLGAAAALGSRGAWILVDGCVVALASNLGNLLDVRPGRTLKGCLLALVLLLLASPPAGMLLVAAAALGGAAGFLPVDLRERAMLGDTGANLLGGIVGVVAIGTLGSLARGGLLAVLVGLTVLSELVSFSRVIDSVGALRALDELGRTKHS